jgi:hypothetical protein
MLATTIALAVSGIAQAKDDDDDRKGCSKSILRGLYVFTASGFNIVGGVPQPKAIVELINFNGDGTVTSGQTTVSINGTIVHSSDIPGNYSVGPDCTGTLQFLDGRANPKFDLFVAFKGSQIQMIQSEQAASAGLPVFQGTAERVSR